LSDGSQIRLIESAPTPLLLRSTFRLDRVTEAPAGRTYHGHAHGLTRLTFSAEIAAPTLTDDSGGSIPFTTVKADGLHHLDFTHFGPVSLHIFPS
jgi:hypothetical protein